MLICRMHTVRYIPVVYICNVEVTNVFILNFFGDVIPGGVKFSGNWHDRKLAALYGLP